MPHRTILTERADRQVVELRNPPRFAMMLEPNLAGEENKLLANFALLDCGLPSDSSNLIFVS
jgi:hypothetical protein